MQSHRAERAVALMAGRVLACLGLFAALAACRAEPAPRAAYRGTVVIGRDYVQVLATAAGDHGCPPRIQQAGTCVRTPPAADPSCAGRPTCISQLTISAPGRQTVRAELGFATVPWLADDRPAALTLSIVGCGGNQSLRVPLGDAALAPFVEARAPRAAGDIAAHWSPADADQVCGLWRWPGGVEVCCERDRGGASFSVPATATDFRLSRGVLVQTVGELSIYQTRETGNLLAD